MDVFPQVLKNVRVAQKVPFEELPDLTASIQSVESKLKGKGRVLVRYSGTENLARIMVEGEDLAMLENYAGSIAEGFKSLSVWETKFLIRLGVNIDHVATLRNARGESYPSPVQAALLAELGGADNITCHLREDRRHIRDRDVELLREVIQIPLNFEMAVTDEMISFAKKLKPHAVTLVPEKRQELTTEGGLALEAFDRKLAKSIEELKDLGILVSLFIDPRKEAVELSKKLGAQAIEIHTGDFVPISTKRRQEKLNWIALSV